jgi:poly [ADP-ribose] polymerase
MSSAIRESRFIKASVENNNNKFWYITEYDDASCLVQYGRVGGDGAQKVHRFGNQVQATRFFDNKCREKQGERKGYRKLDVLAGTNGAEAVGKQRLAQVAAAQIRTDCPQTKALIGYLTQVNAHNILAATTLQFDVDQGLFRTPCGIVTSQSLQDARALLTKIGQYVAKKDFQNPAYLCILNDYLMLIPQKVGRKLDPATLYPDRAAVQQQNDILDALDASLQSVLAKSQDKNGTADDELPAVFDVKLHLVDASREVQRIRTKYHSTLQRMHACAHLDVRKVYAVEIASIHKAWEAQGRKVGNVLELWHGTKASNLLSILKGGLVIPPSNAPFCTGRMFGNGIYFSDQSTKSLNYAYGYWKGRAENHCFMFLADVAMGKSYVPQSHAERLPKPGYHSTFAKAQVSGVMNNEMIVYHTHQVNLRYLVEFGAGR